MNYATRTIWGLAASLILLGGVNAAEEGASGDMTEASKTRETRVEGKAENQARIERRADETQAGEPSPGGAMGTLESETIIEREGNVTTPRTAETVTVTGRIVDLTSYMSDGQITSYDASKVKAGETPLVGLLTQDNRIHLILNCDQNSEFMRTLKNRSTDNYSVTGERMTRGGMSAIKVKSAEVSTDTTTQAQPQNEMDSTNRSADPNANNDGREIDSNLKDRGPASTNNPAIEKH